MQVTPEGVAHFLLETPQFAPKTRSQNAATASAIPTSTWHPKVMQIHTNPYIQNSHPIHRNLKRHSFLSFFYCAAWWTVIVCHGSAWVAKRISSARCSSSSTTSLALSMAWSAELLAGQTSTVINTVTTQWFKKIRFIPLYWRSLLKS